MYADEKQNYVNLIMQYVLTRMRFKPVSAEHNGVYSSPLP